MAVAGGAAQGALHPPWHCRPLRCPRSRTSPDPLSAYPPGLLNWADVGLGFLARAGNAYYTERLSTAARVNIAALLAVVGFVGLALAHHVGFWFALLSITLVGGSASWGESCLLGYLKGYPEALTGAWGSGTGAWCAGACEWVHD